MEIVDELTSLERSASLGFIFIINFENTCIAYGQTSLNKCGSSVLCDIIQFYMSCSCDIQVD